MKGPRQRLAHCALLCGLTAATTQPVTFAAAAFSTIPNEGPAATAVHAPGDSSNAVIDGRAVAVSMGPAASSSANVPAAAAAVGYNTLTFNSTVLGKGWFPFEFFGSKQPAGSAVQNPDGSIFLSGKSGTSFGGTLSSALATSAAPYFTGVAFGGGGYFEATLSFTGQGNGPYANGGPAFWAEDIEHMSADSNINPQHVQWPGSDRPWSSSTTYAIDAIVSHGGYYWISAVNGNVGNTPKNGSSQWQPYQSWIEVDFMEYDAGKYLYQNGIGHWATFPGGSFSTSNPYQGARNCRGCVAVPTGTDFSKPHRYGCLWVPATPTTRGYLKFYFDGVQTASPTFYWNYYDPASPPPPVNGSTAMSVMDQRHLALILGTGTDQPMTVQSVSAWQGSSANNLTR
jgi:hypothetical protein